MDELVSVTKNGAIAQVTITREKALNALNRDVLVALLDQAVQLDVDDEVRVVILTGAGQKAFVAGADIGAMSELRPRDALAFAELGGDVLGQIESSQKVWIAAVNGFALGGGLELALACDFIYAARTAKLGQPEVKLGIIPGFGGTQRLLRRVGIGKARELIFTGDIIEADEALRIGLADALCAPEELLAKARATAGRIADKGPLAVAAAKRVMNRGQSLPLDEAISLEGHIFANLFDSADQKEGMAAFIEKRAPAFTGK